MKLLVLSWKDVTESTVQNCFAKAGIFVEERDRAENDLDDPFSELRSNLEEWEKRQEFAAPSDLSPEDFVGLDDSVVATEAALSVDGIIESLKDSTNVISVDDDEIGQYETDDDECLQKPTTADVRNAIDTLMDLSLFVESDGIRSSIVNVSKLIEKELSSHLRQATIHDYFHKD